MVEQLVPPTVHSVFILSLGLHSYSPAVQLFNQVRILNSTWHKQLLFNTAVFTLMQLSTEAYSKLSSGDGDCVAVDGIFMDVHGHYVCSIEGLQELLTRKNINEKRCTVIY